MAEQQENRTPTIVATVTALWVLSYIAVGARFWGRFVGDSKLWWDDWLILLAAVCTHIDHSRLLKKRLDLMAAQGNARSGSDSRLD